MTEYQYQLARKVMQKANYLRGQITKAKGEVAKWTHIEGSHRKELKTAQADGTNKIVLKWLDILKERRQKLEDLKFPVDVPTPEPNRCKECGCKIAEGNTHCAECLCENDSNY